MKTRFLLFFLTLSLLVSSLSFASEKKSVRIAVIDTGISTAAIDSDCLDIGLNYVLPGESTEDILGHGTAVASIIVGSDSAGVTGVCPEATLIPMVFISKDSDGWSTSGNADDLAILIRKAIDDYDCDLINISLTSLDTTANLEEAVEYAQQKDVLIVASSGNSGNLITYYPGGYESTLCVGSVNEIGTSYADFSNRNKSLDILAPGINVPIALIDGTASIDSGTSFSTAYVSGIAAKLMMQYPSLSSAQIKQILCSSAKDLLSPGYDYDTGWGVLDRDTAFTYASQGRQFRDAAVSEWYFPGVKFMSSRGLMNGIDAVTFAPQQTTTHAMMWVMLYRLDGQPETSTSTIWYQDAQLWVANHNIANISSPNRTITREEIVSMLYQYIQYRGFDVSHTKSVDLSKFQDAGTVSPNAVDSMRWAYAERIIDGVGGNKLAPLEYATRAQIATIFMRFSGLLTN